MDVITSTELKSKLGLRAREVVLKRKPLVVKFPFGFMKCEAWDIPEEVPEFPKGTIKLSKRELELANTLADSL